MATARLSSATRRLFESYVAHRWNARALGGGRSLPTVPRTTRGLPHATRLVKINERRAARGKLALPSPRSRDLAKLASLSGTFSLGGVLGSREKSKAVWDAAIRRANSRSEAARKAWITRRRGRSK